VKNTSLERMSVDALWILREKIRSNLSKKIEAEKQELERRLARLQGRTENKPVARRSYPRVFPKYRNPETPFETWSGRGSDRTGSADNYGQERSSTNC
jgi:DNA-binding protein H-NS